MNNVARFLPLKPLPWLVGADYPGYPLSIPTSPPFRVSGEELLLRAHFLSDKQR